MAPSVLRRRFATAAGLYLSVALGIVGTIAAARILGLEDFGRFATVMAVVGLAQTLLDLTVEESLTKFGFRYIAAEDWGKLHRLFRRALELKLVGGALASVMLLALAPVADTIFGTDGLAAPMAAAAAIPFLASPENVSASALLLRGRYDLRGWLLSVTMGIRLIAILVGASIGVAAALGALAVGQLLATAIAGTAGSIALRRFRAPTRGRWGRPPRDRLLRGPLERRDRRRLAAKRTDAGPARACRRDDAGRLLPGRARPPERILGGQRARPAGAPDRADARLGVRARADGAPRAAPVLAQRGGRRGGRRPRLPSGDALARPRRVRERVPPAVDAARIVLVAAAIQLVLGWSKSLPVTIGRPHLRVVTHGIEALVLLPLVVVLGDRWG